MINSTQSGSYHTKIRPVRYGLLTSLNKTDTLRAIELTSSMWGGAYNPLIPNLQRMDPSWKQGLSALTAAELVSGYIDNFDPDVLVLPDGMSINEEYKLFRRATHFENIENTVYARSSDFHIKNEVPELIICLYKLIEDEYKYLRQDKSKILIPIFENNSLALSAIFGSTNSEVLNEIKNNEHISQFVEFPVVSMKDVNRLLTSGDTFTRRVTLSDFRYPKPRNPSVFIFDHEKPADIIRYWNLRAAGNFVYPLPSSHDSLTDIENVPDFFDRVLDKDSSPLSIIQSPTLNDKKKEIASELINMCKGAGHIRTVSEYPPFHTGKFIGNQTSNAVEKFYVGWKRDDVLVDERVELKLFHPELCKWSNSIDCINAIDIHYYEGPKLMAEVFPDCKDQYLYLGRPFGGRARYNSEGIVVRVKSFSDSAILPAATSEIVLKYWMIDQGWKNGEISTAGRICNQVLSLLQGKWLIPILTYPGLLSLVSKGERKAGLNLDQCLAILKTDGVAEDLAQSRLEMLIEYGVLKVGYSTSCSYCKQTNWCSLSDLDYKLCCDRCLTTYRVDTADPNRLIWSCRVSGPFAHSEFSGSFSPLLAYKFLESLYQSTSTMFGFKGQHEGREYEIDLLCFLKDSFSEDNAQLVIGECKTTNRFKNKDTQRMYETASKFKNAYVVFATMNKTLSDTEKSLLIAFYKRLEKSELYSKIIILTRKELCCLDVDREWVEISDIHKRAHDKYNQWPSKLLWLSKVTVEIHLGIDTKT